MTPSIFAQLLDALQQALTPGLGAMRSAILGAFGFLVFLEATRLGVGFALGATDLARTATRFLLRSGVLLWLVLDYPTVVNLIYKSFVQLGLTAGGGALTVPQFLDAGTYLSHGMRAGNILFETATANLGLTSIPLALAFLVSWVLFVVAYGVMGISVFILQVEFTITVMAALVMLPFAVLHGTGWIAQGAIAYPINVGFRFFVLALLASVVFPLLNQITTTVATLQTAVIMVLVAWMIAFLFFKGPSIAAGILAGMPVLSAGQVIQAAAGTAAVAGAGIALGAAAIGTTGAALAAGGRGLQSGVALLRQGGAATQAAQALPAGTTRQLSSPGVTSRALSTGRAFQQTLAQASRYFAHDGGHGGTNTHLP